ncbi:hypothetical protein MNBD_ALPHA11-292, partial [hydrothermal vent metagenome]
VLGFVEQSVSILSSGKTLIVGATAVSPADTNESYGVQSAIETIAGTGGDDVIYADNQDYAPSGTSSRLVEITLDLPFESWTPVSLIVTNLPPGMSVLNAIETSKGYLIELTPDTAFLHTIELNFTLPVDGAVQDANGFYDIDSISIEYTLVDPRGDTGQSQASAAIGLREILGDADLQFIDPATGNIVTAIDANPPGNIINAGAGNDEIYAATGADQIDGGGGEDLVSYSVSSAAVDVDLGANTASGGYAEGDVLSNIENLEGSRFDDNLVGNADDNILTGLAGADQIDGGAGTDTANYFASDEGVTVSLVTGLGTGGDAQGDQLSNIENLIGSEFDDQLIGDAGINRIDGGDGDDIIAGSVGADELIGGDGVDILDYSTSAAAINVNLATQSGTGGDATGDNFSGFEGITGTAFDDVLVGDGNDNRLQGGDGNDNLTGGAGADSLIGGDGDDNLTGGSGADEIDGGDGVDTAIYSASSAGVSVSLATGVGNGGDAQDDKVFY